MPVPDGADTAHLGIALLGPRSRLLDDLGAEDEWLPIPGYYESESRLFSIALSYLFIEGSIVVLVEHPNLVPLSLPSAQTPSASPQLRSLTIQDADFSVKCGNFTDAGQCLPEDERTFEKRLQDAYDKYTGLGYSGPALHHGIMTVNLLGIKNFIRIETAEYTGNQINDGSVEPCVSGPKAQYMTVARIMTFCYQRDHDDDVTVGSETRHEMFHAFQHHFEALNRDVLNATQGVDLDNVLPSQKPAIENYGWIVEGTAAAAEDSAETMSRSRIHERLLLPLNVALTASHLAGNTDPAWIEYRAQDFWVYFGLKKNLGLIYLKTLFAYGATPAGADQFFIIEHGTSLGAEYWGWVKNQAVEKTFDSDRKLGNPGQINLEATGTPRGLLYPPRDQLPSVEGTLPRLTSEVVQIVFSAGEIGETSYTVTVAAATVSGAANGLAYKVYKQGETDFAVQENEPRTFVQEPLPFVVYVILSNVQYQPENSLSYRVSVFKS